MTTKISIIFQNNHFILVDKPAGLNFHSEDDKAGVIELIKQQEGIETLFPVHRLDKMTSGLLIVALNKATANQFLELFSERKIDKYYLAVSNSKPKKKQGWIKGDMLATRNGSWKLAKTMIKPAITRFISVSIQSGERLYLLKPETGKTHQLRVALKSISAPICGDQRYANRVEAIEEDRGYLHAYALKFNLAGHLFEFVRAPENGSRFLTKACRGKIEEWTKPWSLFK